MATHSSILAWRIPGTEEPSGAAVYGVAQSQTRLKRLSSSRTKATVSLSDSPSWSSNVHWECGPPLRVLKELQICGSLPWLNISIIRERSKYTYT